MICSIKDEEEGLLGEISDRMNKNKNEMNMRYEQQENGQNG